MKKIIIDNLTLPIGSCRLERSESGAQVILENEKAFSITLPESCILQKLSENKGQVITKHDLIVAAWGRPEIIGSNSLPVAITNLRKILEIANIKITNVPRKGYKIDIPVAEERVVLEAVSLSSKQEQIENQPEKKFPLVQGGVEKAKLYGALITLFFSTYAVMYASFSWVKVDCQIFGEATVCSLKGERPNSTQVDGKQGFFYFSKSTGLMEVNHAEA